MRDIDVKFYHPRESSNFGTVGLRRIQIMVDAFTDVTFYILEHAKIFFDFSTYCSKLNLHHNLDNQIICRIIDICFV